MNSDVPSSEHELSQDGSSQDDSNEKSVSSHTSNESLNQAELSDKPEVEPQLKNDSVDTANEQSSSSSHSNNKGPDTEARLQQLEKEHETLNSQYMRIAADFDNFRKRQTRDQDDLKIHSAGKDEEAPRVHDCQNLLSYPLGQPIQGPIQA